jgi:hypothetical protein
VSHLLFLFQGHGGSAVRQKEGFHGRSKLFFLFFFLFGDNEIIGS